MTDDDAGEIFLPIPGWEGFYSVSSHGRVMSLPRKVQVAGQVARRYSRSRILKPSVRPSGREQYMLFRNGQGFVRSIEFLMQQARILVNAAQLDAILEAVGAAPCLPGARCRGKHHLFDVAALHEPPKAVEARHRPALGLCSRCPALARCQDWFNSLPPRQRPEGVVAGKLRPAEVGRPRKSNHQSTEGK